MRPEVVQHHQQDGNAPQPVQFTNMAARRHRRPQQECRIVFIGPWIDSRHDFKIHNRWNQWSEKEPTRAFCCLCADDTECNAGGGSDPLPRSTWDSPFVRGDRRFSPYKGIRSPFWGEGFIPA